jgi:hypothetical protein
MYLEVMTAAEPGMDGHAIHGTPHDISRLASLVEQRVSGMKAGDTVRIREEYAPGTAYTLRLQLCGDDFDPASRDGNLVAG